MLIPTTHTARPVTTMDPTMKSIHTWEVEEVVQVITEEDINHITHVIVTENTAAAAAATMAAGTSTAVILMITNKVAHHTAAHTVAHTGLDMVDIAATAAIASMAVDITADTAATADQVHMEESAVLATADKVDTADTVAQAQAAMAVLCLDTIRSHLTATAVVNSNMAEVDLRAAQVEVLDLVKVQQLQPVQPVALEVPVRQAELEVHQVALKISLAVILAAQVDQVDRASVVEPAQDLANTARVDSLVDPATNQTATSPVVQVQALVQVTAQATVLVMALATDLATRVAKKVAKGVHSVATAANLLQTMV